VTLYSGQSLGFEEKCSRQGRMLVQHRHLSGDGNEHPKKLSAAAFIGTLLTTSTSALAVDIQIDFTGYVTHSNTSLIDLNDVFNFSLTYQTTTAGDCPDAVDFSSMVIYRCVDAVTSANASVGAIKLSTLSTEPFPYPMDASQSRLSASSSDKLFLTPYDEFQGGVNFSPVSGINYPAVAFYLVDLTGTAIPNPPKLPATWDSSSITSYQHGSFAVFDYTNGPYSIAEGAITFIPAAPIPESGISALMALGLGIISWAHRKSSRTI
jgi:hypothetical protein